MLVDDETCWALTDGKRGDVVQCLGVAGYLGFNTEQRIVHPRLPWAWLAPRGPVDPREGLGVAAGPLRAPFPDIVIASGRRAVPYLRAVKRGSGGRSFTVFLKDPYIGPATADVIWVPEHDRLRGDNVIVTLTSPNLLTREGLAQARAMPDARLVALPRPRVAMLLGGPSARYRFTEADNRRIVDIARFVLARGHSLMVTPSRRTPEPLLSPLRDLGRDPATRERCFVWDGEGPNPYVSMLALADALIVTGDSVNMLGEAAMTGAPIHIVEPSGGHPKMTRFIDRLVRHGAARRWGGRLESFSYEPLDATPEIARQVLERYRAFRSGAR